MKAYSLELKLTSYCDCHVVRLLSFFLYSVNSFGEGCLRMNICYHEPTKDHGLENLL